jgi:hypothetical protein
MTTHNDNWLLAESLQLTPANHPLGAGYHGIVTARPHPTGWFISARYRVDLAAGDLADFAEFARVRSYLLLENGPRKPAWELAEDRSWRAAYKPSSVNLPQDVEAWRSPAA